VRIRTTPPADESPRERPAGARFPISDEENTMRLRTTSRIAALAGLGAFALALPIIAQDAGTQRTGGGQNTSSGGQTRTESRDAQGQPGGQHGATAGHHHDQVMLISHGLAMAIEGSTLQALSMQSGGNAQAGGNAAGNQGQAGRSSGQQLQQHARSAFEASDRLLRQAGQGGNDRAGDRQQAQGNDNQGNRSPVMRFQAAANEYASVLRRLGDRNEGGNNAGGNNANANAGASGADMRTVAVLNHAVKEALDAHKMRHMTRMMGNTDNQAMQMLQQHAQEMDRESRQAIGQFASNRGAGDAANDRGGAGAGTGGQAPRTANPTDGDTKAPTADQRREEQELREKGATTNRDQIRASNDRTAKATTVSPPISDNAGNRIADATAGQGQGQGQGQTQGQGGAVTTLAARAQDILRALGELEGRNAGQGGAQGRAGSDNTDRSKSGSNDR